MTVSIPLPSGEVVQICDDDSDLADPMFHWYLHKKNNFVCCTVGKAPNKSMLVLHRIIFERGHDPLHPRQQIENLDGDPLNCQRENLRLRRKHFKNPPGSLRRTNTSGVTGVSRWGRKWKVFIREKRGGPNVYLGTYRSLEEGGAVYQAANEKKARGEKLRDR